LKQTHTHQANVTKPLFIDGLVFVNICDRTNKIDVESGEYWMSFCTRYACGTVNNKKRKSIVHSWCKWADGAQD